MRESAAWLAPDAVIDGLIEQWARWISGGITDEIFLQRLRDTHALYKVTNPHMFEEG